MFGPPILHKTKVKNDKVNIWKRYKITNWTNYFFGLQFGRKVERYLLRPGKRNRIYKHFWYFKTVFRGSIFIIFQTTYWVYFRILGPNRLLGELPFRVLQGGPGRSSFSGSTVRDSAAWIMKGAWQLTNVLSLGQTDWVSLHIKESFTK